MQTKHLRYLKITPRQLELTALFASGYDYQAIADMKFLSYNTVRRDLKAAQDRLGAKSITHACVILLDFGLIARNGVGYKPVIDDDSSRAIV